MVATSSSTGDSDSSLITKGECNVMERLVNTFKRNQSSSTAQGTSKTAVEASVQAQKYKFALDGFAESTKVALDILTALGEIHPFIKGPVVAFKVVLTLDLKRRENEAKVQAMKVEMQSMMAVFLQLQDHPDPQAFQADAGLQSLMKDVEEEIRNAFAFCDYYMNKSLMRRCRCLKSSIYEIRFADYAQRFYDLGVQLHRQLSIHMIWGIYGIQKSCDELNTQMEEVKSQLKYLFTLLETDREKELLSFIERSGGARACVEDDGSLHELMSKSGENTRDGWEGGGAQKFKKSLRDELSEDLDKALQNNLSVFQGKLDIQLHEINLNISRESNRVISALSGGHEQIADKHIREIWRDMGWKSTVKARHFVFALRDYYHGGLHYHHLAQESTSSRAPSLLLGLPTLPSQDPLDISLETNGDDGWTLQYIHVSFLQPIAEAIDDDGSSFITIREINDFITMRPQSYSTLQWLAYWAAGWHSSVSQYVDKIYRLLRKFHRLREEVRLENLVIYDDYLHHPAFTRLHHLLRSTRKATVAIHPQLAKLRNEFTKAEEDRLFENLKKLSFTLDSSATVKLVTGPYRIKRYIYPLIYVLLKRHLQVIQLGRLHTLNSNEFDDKAGSLHFIFVIFNQRMDELFAVFQQMNLAPKSHFEHYAFGMFHSSFNGPMWRERDDTTHKAWASLPIEAGENDDVETCPKDISVDILQYTPADPFELDRSLVSADLVNLDCNSSTISGSWSVQLYDEKDDYGGHFLIDLKAPQSGRDQGTGTSTGYTWFDNLEVTYFVIATEADKNDVDIRVLYPSRSGVRLIGAFSTTASSISGESYSYKEEPPSTISSGSGNLHPNIDDRDGLFRLSRTPGSLLSFRYLWTALAQSPVKARWNFVRQAILFGVRRDRMDKNYVKGVLKDCRRFVEVSMQSWMEMTAIEKLGLMELGFRLSPSVASFFHGIAVFLCDRLQRHHGIRCGGPSCTASRRSILQTRYMCIVCYDPHSKCLDLCIDCRDTASPVEFPSHILSHSLIRVHRHLHDCDEFEVLRKAREISRRRKARFLAQDFPACTICNERISLPCFVCVECDDRIVCTACDLKHQTMPWRYKMVSLSTSQFKKLHGNHAMVWIRDDKEVSIPEKDQLTRVEEHVNLVGDLVERSLVKELQPEMNSLISMASERLSALEDRFGSVDTGFSAVEGRFNLVDERFSTVKTRFDSLDERLSAVEKRFDSLDKKLSTVNKRFDSLETLIRSCIRLRTPDSLAD